MSELPKGWTFSNIGECFSEIKNGTTLTQNTDDKGIPVSRIETIQNNKFDLNRVRHVEKISEEVLEVYRYKIGDIALSHINSYEHVGKTALYDGKPKEFIHGMNLLRLRFGHNYIYPKFAHLFMQTNSFREEVRRRVGHAVNQVSINQKNLSEVPFIIAPLNEQRRIVEKLEKILGRVEAARERLERVPLILKRFRQSVLAAACSGKLTADWREQNPYESSKELKDKIIAEHNRLTNINIDESQLPNKPMDFDLPENWSWLNTSQIFHFVTSGSRGWARYYADYGALFIRVGNLDHDSISLDFSSKQFVRPPQNSEGTRTRVQQGDLLVSITADVGMIGLVDSEFEEAYINQHVALARPVNPIDKKFLAYFLTCKKGGQTQFRELQRGATKAGLGLDDIKSVWVALPSITEQQEIVRRVEELFALADTIEERYRKAKRNFDKLTQSVLAKAFRGELVPQDERDEPASVLLERIKQERANNEKPKQEKKRTPSLPFK